MWVGGMPGLWACREEGRRRAGTRGVPGCGPIVPGRWGGGVPGRWGRGVPGLGAKAGRTNGAEVCRDEGRAGMRGGGMPCYTGTSGVPGCRAEACPVPARWGGRGGGWGVVSYLSARRARSRRSPVTVQRWPCRGARCSGRDPLVVSPAEGATRRSVTVSRDQPAPQPLREQEQIRAAQGPSQKVQLGPSQSVDWITACSAEGGLPDGVFTQAYLRNAATVRRPF